MRYFYIALLAVGMVLLIVLFFSLRKIYAKGKVRKMDVGTKIQKLNKALRSFGFQYDETNDAVCSGMYPWQREMGYCRAYDKYAFAMFMVFDCEPVYFNYNGARYLLEIWKGQYGCTTGAEIGLYVNRTGDFQTPAEELFYECVEDNERLPMSYTLYKNGEKVQQRDGVHWWLTGFEVGMFSDKSELDMEVLIVFPNAVMCRAFYEGLVKIGYGKRSIHVDHNRVHFWFDRPFSEQPTACGKWCSKRVMRRNRKNCKLYMRVSGKFYTTLDRITYIGYCYPVLYRTLMGLGMKAGKRRFRRIKRKLSK